MAFIQMKAIYLESVDSSVDVTVVSRKHLRNVASENRAYDLVDIHKMLHFEWRSKSHKTILIKL